MESYFQSGLALSTQRSYSSAKRRFLSFCELTPLPLTEQLLCRYVSHLRDQGLSPKTVICSKTSMNLQDPRIREMPKLEQVIRGVKREHAKQSPGKQVRLPITPEILLKLRGVWEARSKNHNAIMLWGACCLCYFGFLRAEEITVPSEAAYDPGEHLNFTDVAVDSISNPKLLKVKIKVSKTDPFRQGVDLFIGKTGNKLCPVAAMLSYLAKRGSEEGMLFYYEDRKLLTRDQFVASVRDALTIVGADC